jgi:hypothetical protein
MKVFTAALRALPLSFLLYLIQAAAALLTSVPLGLELLADERATLTSPAGRAAWLDRGLELLPALGVARQSALIVAALLLLSSPWLQMAWLAALARPVGVLGALEQGARSYLRALTVSVLSLACLALALLPGAGTAWLCHTLLAAPSHARLHDLLLIACAVPCLGIVWIAHVAHDLARACSLRRGAWTSLRSGLRGALRPRVQLVGLSLAGAALGLRSIHYYVWREGARLDLVSTTALLQGACFAALFLRSLWLGSCLACVEQPATSGDLE